MTELPVPGTRAELLALVTAAGDDQLSAALAAHGDAILGGIFARMAEGLDPEAAGDTRAVIEWQVAGGPDDPPRRWQLVVAGGACAAEPGATREPDVVFTIDGVDFLRMVSGAEDPGRLFMFGRLQATGDLFLAARTRTFFPPPQ
jgi:hypothetical protein